jgi:hypothetical protein
MSYSRDTEIELKGTFHDASDQLADPTDVTLEVLDPSGTKTTYTYGNSEVTKESLGVYTRAQTLDASGVWYYRFKGTGAVKVAAWKRLDVTDDPLN